MTANCSANQPVFEGSSAAGAFTTATAFFTSGIVGPASTAPTDAVPKALNTAIVNAVRDNICFITVSPFVL